MQLKPGTSVAFSGQFELLERANHKLKLMVPMTLMIIFVLLYLAFRRVGEALLIISSVPFALVGGIWLLWWMGFHLLWRRAPVLLPLPGSPPNLAW